MRLFNNSLSPKIQLPAFFVDFLSLMGKQRAGINIHQLLQLPVYISYKSALEYDSQDKHEPLGFNKPRKKNSVDFINNGSKLQQNICKDYRDCAEILKHHIKRGLRPLLLIFSSTSESNMTEIFDRPIHYINKRAFKITCSFFNTRWFS